MHFRQTSEMCDVGWLLPCSSLPQNRSQDFKFLSLEEIPSTSFFCPRIGKFLQVKDINLSTSVVMTKSLHKCCHDQYSLLVAISFYFPWLVKQTASWDEIMGCGRSKTMMGRNEWDGKKLTRKKMGWKGIQKLQAKNQRPPRELNMTLKIKTEGWF